IEDRRAFGMPFQTLDVEIDRALTGRIRAEGNVTAAHKSGQNRHRSSLLTTMYLSFDNAMSAFIQYISFCAFSALPLGRARIETAPVTASVTAPASASASASATAPATATATAPAMASATATATATTRLHPEETTQYGPASYGINPPFCDDVYCGP